MKRNTVWCRVALLLVALLCVGCREPGGARPASGAEADCVVNGSRIWFADEQQRQAWQQPLAELLSRVSEWDDRADFEEILDPDAPALPQSYRCGLLDVTGDQTPELLVHPRGFHGSSGTATYFVYDLYSGQKLGELDGGNGQSWCVYYEVASGQLRLMGQYWLRGGWTWRERYLNEAVYDAATGECREVSYLRTEHEIAWAEMDADAAAEGVAEAYPATAYYVYGKAVCLDEYYAEYEQFLQAFVRIPETELVLIDWSDVTDEGDDAFAKGEKMAEALLGSGQAFITAVEVGNTGR